MLAGKAVDGSERLLFLEDQVEQPRAPGRSGGRGRRRCDRLSDGLSLVYSFYDPDHHDRSLGSYIILEHIEYARSLKLPYVYLGYWIEGSRKMAYKSRFTPQERLTRHGWMRVPAETENGKSG